MKAEALFFGVLNIDMVLEAGRHVIGNKIMGERVSTHAGGYGCTQSFGCSRCGIPSAVMGKIGDDAFGRDIIETVREEGVDYSLVQVVANEKTGLSTIIVRADEPNMYLDFLGANFTLNSQYIASCEEQIKQCGFIGAHLGVATVQPSLTLLELAERHRIPTAINFSTVDIPENVFSTKPDFLILSCNTASLLCGFPVDNLKGARIATTLLLSQVKQAIVFQMENLGTIVATSHSWDIIDPCPERKIIDPSGMSDFFTGVFIAQMIKGHGLLDSAAKAHDAAMTCAQRIGVYESLPTKEELL
ncbi:PfkB family carbohydrate kinase [Sediminispirochaeta smaragdinae]|uniref:PfkB domain protein n=1 Tax=Sediminispirochaeta smaragdinae (strain DSM 11293 / JCM 15392 / SEBR 4228) TaxID=573413 RepID=E1RC36_SEDSS|nr:PfkB family carbohydrate kinase [Sediminispirochaeta smaragdinae]ADK79916.1 PfkB domain protein [Sediminispirochaeta smaragdinae DSM 11293]